MDWSPAQYTQFEAERTRPARDLLAQVPLDAPAQVVDLGCGPGNSTELLAARWPAADLLGLDSSPAMIAAAEARLRGRRFAVADIASWQPPQPVDLLYANAALQWLPDHDRLLPRLLGLLAPGGVLAVQVPDNLDEPSHRAMPAVAARGPWAERLAGAGAARSPRLPAERYYEILRGAGARTVEIWRTEYLHPLAGGPAAISAWLQSTGLRPYLQPLTEGERADFLAAYEAEIAPHYPVQRDGTVLLRFPRLFFVAMR